LSLVENLKPPLAENQELASKYFICSELECGYKATRDDISNICPICYSIGISIDIDELINAPDGADVLEYIYEQMGFK
jgi:hypothetical protein